MPLAFGKLVSTLLTELNLASNYIEDDGAKAIAEALKVNPVLTNLDLRLNSIGDDGAKAIAEALKVNPVLTNFPNASGTLRRTPKLCEIPMC